jgi:hypothetical protein
VRQPTIATLRVPSKPAPEVELPGTPRPAMHPAPSVGDVRVWGAGEWDQWNPGTHGELVARASTPTGEQTRQSNVRGNSFRLAPEPWDAAQFVGYRPAPEDR